MSRQDRPFLIPPERERPDSPPESYGVPRSGGRWVEWDHVLDWLTNASGYWLATVTPSGHPHVVPIWGVLVDGELYLETGAPETIKNRNLAINEHVQVHLDGVDDVVIVRGRADPFVPRGDLARAIAGAMHAKYPGYEPAPDSWDQGGLFRIEPRTVLAWKEMPTATRWRFPRG